MSTKVIWKYTFSGNKSVISMPKGAKILTVQEQFGRISIWVLVDAKAPKENRYFEIQITGLAFDDDGLKYIGTGQVDDGNYVEHLFERLKNDH